MDLKEFRDTLYNFINYTDSLDVAPLVIDGDGGLFVELTDGTKYEISVRPIDVVI